MDIACTLIVPVPIRQEIRKVQEAFFDAQRGTNPNLVVQSGSCSAILEPLPFDSECFGIPMGRISTIQCRPGGATELLSVCLKRAKELGMRHLTARIPASEVWLAQVLSQQGFFLTDTLATLLNDDLDRQNALSVATACEISRIAVDEVQTIVGHGAKLHVHSRYFNDSTLNPANAEILFRRWLANDCEGRADLVLVARLNGIIAGYIACAFSPSDEFCASYASIDLIAVFENAQGRGIGKALVYSAIGHLHDVTKRLFVGTQGGNRPALKLYQATGFQLTDLDLTYHWAAIQ